MKSEYVFTITEQGQKQPIKTVTVPYEKLTNKAFSVSLNRLMLYDLPEEEDSLTSLATWKDGNKELSTLDSTELVDKLSYNLHEIKEDWYVVAQAIDVEATKDAQEKMKSQTSGNCRNNDHFGEQRENRYLENSA